MRSAFLSGRFATTTNYSMPFFKSNNINFHYQDQGEGKPWIFLHGMGADLNQAALVFSRIEGVRFISMDFRGHGKTAFSAPGDFQFKRFADDVMNLADHLGMKQFGLGGISLGSAVSLNIVSRFPERVRQLVLIRPAWLDKANADNLEVSSLIGSILSQFGEAGAETRFRQSNLFQKLNVDAPGSLESIAGQLSRPYASVSFSAFSNLVLDSPVDSIETLKDIQQETLVMGNEQDPIHPIGMARQLAELLPNASFYQLPERYVDAEVHYEEAYQRVKKFIAPPF